jgi:NADPH:quinone reductase-like Zn-dependent oxidoreductase
MQNDYLDSENSWRIRTMRAAVISIPGGVPVITDFAPPKAQDGCVLIDVDTAGLGGWDVLGAYRLGVQFPCVIRGEGVGRSPDGRRVYFGERSTPPWGAWAERTVVPEAEVWDVPDDVDDRTAITMGIAGTGIAVPLEAAKIQKGERVLILGATGTLGQIGLQLARNAGAGQVVAAARSQAGLDRLMERGIADAVVAMDGENDAEALKAASGDGFDVVLDLVFGQPFLAALKATKWGARLITIGTGAGRTVELNIGELLFRTLTCIGTGQRAPADRRAIWERLLVTAREQNITVDYADYEFDQASAAWVAQVSGPHAKITAKIR